MKNTTEYIEGKLEEWDKLWKTCKGDCYYSNSATRESYSKIIGSWEAENEIIKDFLRSFAHDLVAETRKETLKLIREEFKKRSSEEFWGRFDEYKKIADWSQKLLEEVLLRADLQEKMKGGNV